MIQNRPFRIGTLSLALISLALVTSCDDPSSPELLESWVLESWLGLEPPVPFRDMEDPDEPGVVCTHLLVSSEIELRTERRMDMIDSLTETCGGGEARPYSEVRHGTWAMAGDSLFLEIETGDPILPEAPLDGRIVGDRLRFEYEVFSEAGGIDTVAIVYRRAVIPFPGS